MDVQAMGKAGLTGVKGRVGGRVAGAVAKRTSFSRDQVEAAIGAVLLLLALFQFLALARRVVRAGLEGEGAPQG